MCESRLQSIAESPLAIAIRLDDDENNVIGE